MTQAEPQNTCTATAELRIAEVGLLMHSHPNTFLTHAQQLQDELAEMGASREAQYRGMLVLAVAWASHGNPRLAEHIFNQAREWAHRDLESPLEFEAWIDLYIVVGQLLSQSRRNETDKLFGALEVFQHNNQYEGIVVTHLVFGAFFHDRDDSNRALSHLSRAIHAISKAPSSPTRSTLMVRAAAQYTRFGYPNLAIPLLQDVIELHSEHRALRTFAHLHLAKAVAKLDDATATNDAFRTAVHEAREHSRAQLPFVLLEYGLYLFKAKEYSHAANILWHAHDVAMSNNNPTSATDILEVLANSLHQGGKHKEGFNALRTYHQLALKVNQQHAAQEHEFQLVSERINEARQAALTDTLTALHNRRSFNQYFAQLAQYARASKQEFSVVFIDIDEFKKVNDRFGHPIGDEALKHFADILNESVRDEDFVARIGGDEFAIIARTSRDGADVIVKHVADSLRDAQWFRIHPDLKVTASCGIASSSEIALNTKDLQQELIHLADMRQLSSKPAVATAQ